jgi:hypothetical protein
VRDTSNILIGRIVDTSNYVRDTSNILIGRVVDTSNYARDTSNILVGRIVDTSNYVRDTSNILVGRIVDTSNYVRDTSNILIGRIGDTSNYVGSTSNILVKLIKSIQSSGGFSGTSSQWTTTEVNQMIYYNAGNVGIGTINPNSKLHLYDEVNTTTKLTIQNNSSSSIELIRGVLADTNIDYSIGNYNGDFKIISSSSVAVTDRLVINSTGDFNITGSLSVSGNITAYYSDERLKTKIANINDPLKIIDKLNGFYYIPNELALSLSIKNTKLDIGLSAQEVQKVLPELVNIAPFDIVKDKYGNKVSKSGENYLTLSYDRLAPVFVEAIKELNQKNKSLTNNNIELTNNNIELTNNNIELTNNNIELKEKYNKLAEDIVLIKKTLKLI